MPLTNGHDFYHNCFQMRPSGHKQVTKNLVGFEHGLHPFVKMHIAYLNLWKKKSVCAKPQQLWKKKAWKSLETVEVGF